jgi:hypothetical protein
MTKEEFKDLTGVDAEEQFGDVWQEVLEDEEKADEAVRELQNQFD